MIFIIFFIKKIQKNYFRLYNSNFNLLYTLISYLSFIDFFSCAIAIPVTAYEILNNQKINEVCCKLFEFIRAFGVIASNFVIVMISIERYIALYKLENSSRKNFFKFRISFVVFLSGFLSILILPLVSVYQKVENRIYYIGICVKSEFLINIKYRKIIYILITSLFVIGLVFVSIIYLIIFIKTKKIKKRHQVRKDLEIQLIKRATENVVIIKDSEIKDNKKYCSINDSVQLDFTILFITFVYYLSVIPWCLTINDIIEYNALIHYTFLLNNTLNPIVYGLLNPNFRSCGFYLFKIKFNSMFK